MDRIFTRVSVLVLFVLFSRPVLSKENNAVLPTPDVPLVPLADHSDFHRLYANTPDEVPPSTQGKAYVATVAGVPLRFLDSDENGKIDGWMVVDKLYNHWLPIREKNVIPQKVGKTVYPVEIVFKFDEDLKTVSWELSGVPTFLDRWPSEWGKPSTSDASSFSDAARRSFNDAIPRLLRWNDLRMRQGLPPLSYGPELSLACLQHGWYMVKTGEYEHTQKPGKWSSVAGANAGLSSSLVKVGDDPVGYEFQTFFHRSVTFRPESDSAGIAIVGPYTLLFPSGPATPTPYLKGVYAIPANFSRGIPLSGMDEIPNPHPQFVRKDRGGPITGFGIWMRAFVYRPKGMKLGLWRLNRTVTSSELKEVESKLGELLSERDRRTLNSNGEPTEDGVTNFVIGKPDLPILGEVLGSFGAESVTFFASWPGNPANPEHDAQNASLAGGPPDLNRMLIGIVPRDFLKPKSTYLWVATFLANSGQNPNLERQLHLGVFETSEITRMK